LSLLLVIAIEGTQLHHLLPELFALFAGRHTGVRGELLPSDLHFDKWVGTQVQIPARLRISPALGPGDDVSFSCCTIKHRRRLLLARPSPYRSEQQARHDVAGETSGGRFK